MPESFVQVAPDSTGRKLHTRQRTVGANVVEEQYVVIQNEAVPVNRTWLSTLRIPVPQSATAVAAAASVNLFSIWNGIASGGNSVSIRRLSAEIDTATAVTTVSPVLRMFRMTTAGSGGTVITPVPQYTADPAQSALVSVRAAHQADGAAPTTALTLGTLGAQPMWTQTMPRMVTASGYQSLNEYNLLPNDSALMQQDPLILRPQEGIGIQAYFPAASAATAAIWTIMFKAAVAEFTYP